MKLINPSPKSTLKRFPEGSIFQGFGENATDYKNIVDPDTGKVVAQFPGGHSGWDILAYEGAPIVAVADGEVVNISYDRTALGGITVRMFHPSIGLYSGYGHLKEDSILVKKGSKVKAGQQIAQMGNTGLIISGGVKFWGNAPANKGVHLHLTIAQIEEGKSSFSFVIDGTRYRVKNLDNGTQGGIDPTPFFTETIKPEIPDVRTLQLKVIELLRALIRSFMKEPVA